ncbi:uncharacterized protein BDR25DRAFT_70766 [Lindgomyces ingoldianus]|uniref:Uncharacterized protein n=1 Tax=Lindgomyces ingoldianus TaxID=673940 RepID=A0ACB6QMI7_9PLEO|nr:uncharacterized protein BDR25DRAFT_70766 [Lindgomyces ingoldianus]KAF2467330.1 hypothetical protein BDR25DRAFT_70766 [Lindgomyces ingoldianus]
MATNIPGMGPLYRYSGIWLTKGRRDSEGRHRGRISIDVTCPLGGLAAVLIIPCAAALLNGQSWAASARAITGVVSTSAGVSLVPLQSEPGYDVLRWVVRALWVSTYCAFLTCSYMSITRNRHLYLFCSLLLAAHFIAGFVGNTTNATEGIQMFGPLAATVCAVLVYIPFRYHSSSNEAVRLGRLRQGSGEGVQHRWSNSRDLDVRGNDGDLGVRGNDRDLGVRGNDGDLGVRAMNGIFGVVV